LRRLLMPTIFFAPLPHACATTGGGFECLSTGFEGFEVIENAGTVIARDGGRDIRTPYDECVLIMPSRRFARGQTAVRLGRFEE